VSTGTMTLTPADVEAQIQVEFEAWKSCDPQRVADLYTGGVGFGYRTLNAHAVYTKEAYLKFLQTWFAQFEQYTITDEQIETSIDGDTGLAWGFYKEEFTVRGQEPEVIRIRFTEVLKRDSSGWRIVFYQRDSQPFDSAGRYIPSAVHRG
jgi:ketosteroid isomerase-like protein